jgi:hypothetical protein
LHPPASQPSQRSDRSDRSDALELTWHETTMILNTNKRWHQSRRPQRCAVSIFGNMPYEKFKDHLLMAGHVAAHRTVISKGANVSYFFIQYKFVVLVFMYTLLQLIIWIGGYFRSALCWYLKWVVCKC